MLHHGVSVVGSLPFSQSITKREHNLSLVGTLTSSQVIGASAIHEKGIEDEILIVSAGIVGHMCADNIAYEEAEKSSINAIKFGFILI